METQRIAVEAPFPFRIELIRGKEWVDPLINYLDKHCALIITDLSDLGLINDMPTLFSYLVDLQEEFLTCNVKYERPVDFRIHYHHQNGKASITIGHIKESIIITETPHHERKIH